jgi:hypothetical protein
VGSVSDHQPPSARPPGREPATAASPRSLLLPALLAVVFGLLFFASGWTVLAACGADTLLGVVVFSWCNRPAAAPAAEDPELQREAVLRDQIAQLERSLRDPRRCGARVALRPPVVVPPAKSEPPATEPPAEALPECPPGKVARPPNELVFVVDTSGSMDLPHNIPPNVDRDLQNNLQSPNPFLRERANAEWERLRRAPVTDRMQLAKTGLGDAIRRAPPVGRMGLVSFGDCGTGGVVDHGSFDPPQRPALVGRIGALQPVSGTPLARALAVAAGLIAGGNTPDDPVNLVVVTDGNDSCGGNPCAVAKALKARKPGLVINVVDLAGWTDVKCIAQATGGFYKSGAGGIDLQPLLREAAGFEGEGMCRTGK